MIRAQFSFESGQLSFLLLKIKFLKNTQYIWNNLLFEAVNITLSSWCKEKYGKHGFKLGFVLTLHTFGRDDKWNPHIHALIAELLVKNNNCKRFDFFPYDMLRKRFQKVMLDLLEKNIGKQKFRQLKNKVYSTLAPDPVPPTQPLYPVVPKKKPVALKVLSSVNVN